MAVSGGKRNRRYEYHTCSMVKKLGCGMMIVTCTIRSNKPERSIKSIPISEWQKVLDILHIVSPRQNG